MNYLTLSGAVDTDPYFDVRSLRPGFHDRHEIHVDIEDRQPLRDCALAVSYRVFVGYTDAGERRVLKVEPLCHQTAEERRRGQEVRSYPLNPFVAAENALLQLLMADVTGEAAGREIDDEVQRHQADRDEDFPA